MSTRKQRRDGIYRRTGSPYFWASYTDASSERIRRSTGTANRKEAEAILAKWKLETFNEKAWGIVPAPLFEEVLLRYLKKRSISASQRTAANHLCNHLSGTDSNATVPRVRDLIETHQEMGMGPAAINKLLVMWSAAINEYNRDLGTSITNPVSKQKLPEPEGRTRWITQDEALELIYQAGLIKKSPVLVELVELSLSTGFRKGEAMGLLVNEIDLSSQAIRLSAARTKTGRSRSVPMTPRVLEIVRDRLRLRARQCPASKYVFSRPDGSPYLDLKKGFRTACDNAGIYDFRWHDQRHTFASWLVQKGVPLDQVRDLLGHASIKQTEKYAHLAPENLKQAVRNLPDLSVQSRETLQIKSFSSS